MSRNSPFDRICVVGLDNFRSPEVEVVYVEAGIYHGGGGGGGGGVAGGRQVHLGGPLCHVSLLEPVTCL